MSTTEAIVAIDSDGFDRLALALSRERRALLDLDIHVDKVFNADELVKAELAILDLLLVVLCDSCLVNILRGVAKGRQLCVLGYLHLELGHDEGVLGEFGLSLLLD